ncbi:MAG: single-stranded-DNA-specific exonuclease RecJ, partial [Bacteroidales bacterium]
MQSIWKIQRLTEEQKKIRDNLSAELSINPVLSQLLVQRGIETVDEARRFFRPQIQDLYDPFLMNDMH